MSSTYSLVFVETGSKYVYVFMFLCSVVLPHFTFFLFYRSGIGGCLPANATQDHNTLGMVISRSLLLFYQANDVAYLSSDSTDSTSPCFHLQRQSWGWKYQQVTTYQTLIIFTWGVSYVAGTFESRTQARIPFDNLIFICFSDPDL